MDERYTDVPVAGAPQPQQTEPGDTGQVGERAEAFSERASEIAVRGRDQARRYGRYARRRLMSVADQRKQHFASELENFAGTLEELGRTLADRGHGAQQDLAERAAGFLRRYSRDLRDQNAEQLYERVESQVRKRPVLFIAGCLAAGFLGARMLRD